MQGVGTLTGQTFERQVGQRLCYDSTTGFFSVVAKNAELQEGQTTNLTTINHKVSEAYQAAYAQPRLSIKEKCNLLHNVALVNQANRLYNHRLYSYKFFLCIDTIIYLFSCCGLYSLQQSDLEEEGPLRADIDQAFAAGGNTGELLEFLSTTPSMIKEMPDLTLRLLMQSLRQFSTLTNANKVHFCNILQERERLGIFVKNIIQADFKNGLCVHDFLLFHCTADQRQRFASLHNLLFDQFLYPNLHREAWLEAQTKMYFNIAFKEAQSAANLHNILRNNQPVSALINGLGKYPELLLPEEERKERAAFATTLFDKLLQNTFDVDNPLSAPPLNALVNQLKQCGIEIDVIRLPHEFQKTLLASLPKLLPSPMPSEKALGNTIYAAFLDKFEELDEDRKTLFLETVSRCKKPHEIPQTLCLPLMAHLIKHPNNGMPLVTSMLAVIKTTLNITAPPGGAGPTPPTRLFLEYLQSLSIKDPQGQFMLTEMGPEAIKRLFCYLYDPKNRKEISPPKLTEAEKKALGEKAKEKENLSLIAIQICYLVETHNLIKQRADHILTVDVLSTLNVSKLTGKNAGFFDMLIGKGCFASFVAKKTDACLASANEEQLERYYQEAENKEYDVNWAHLQIVTREGDAKEADEVVPPLPEGSNVNYEELLKMFSQINFTQKNQPDFVDPAQLEDDGAAIDLDRLKVGMRTFVTTIGGREPSYAPKDPVALALWKQNLERWVKHSILKLRERQPGERSGFLIWLAKAGIHCGGRFHSVAHDLYCQVTGAEYAADAETVEGFVSEILAQRRFQILQVALNEFTREVFAKRRQTYSGVDVHQRAHVLRSNGKQFAIPRKEFKAIDYEDAFIGGRFERVRNREGSEDELVPPSCQKDGLKAILKKAKTMYTPNLIINEMVKHINGLPGHPSTIKDKADFRQQALDPWFVENMPQDFYKKLELKFDETTFKKKFKEEYVAEPFIDMLQKEYGNPNSRHPMIGQVRLKVQEFKRGFVPDYTEMECLKGDVNNAAKKAVDKFFANEFDADFKYQFLAWDNKGFVNIYAQAEREAADEDLLAIRREAVLGEIYYTDADLGRQCIKRQWIIHLLRKSGDGMCVLEKTSKVGRFFKWFR